MKYKNLIHDLRATLKVALRFGRQHLATLNMIEGTYVRKPLKHEQAIGRDSMLLIKAHNSIYQVTRTDYAGSVPTCEETWRASYGWHSNGHLIEIGGDRYCIFDAASGSMYLEFLTERGETKLEFFIKSI